MNTDEDPCHSKHYIEATKSPLISAIMFAMGIFGNVAALVILEIRDAGTRGPSRVGGARCFTSSSRRWWSRTWRAPASSARWCSCRIRATLPWCVAIGYPYLYSRHVTKKCAYISIPVVFLLCMLFCLLPFAGFGKYVQYCPGTWCFIDMNPIGTKDRVYANLYATLMLVLVLAIVACNGFVVYQLFKMYQRRKRNGGSVMGATRSNGERKAMSMAEEVEHLILLVFMTIIFIICTLPLVIRVYINSIQKRESHPMDLIALRFISVNSIIDPWVFILLSPSVLHFCWAYISRAPLGLSRGSVFKSSMAKENSPGNIELSRPTLEYTEHFPSGESL
ncbi:hypothetical protein PBY51_016797 [Eleginops maclovinus]|uniref:G-protein coupled receptors family 1 profile domain-containing protein n=1 Tax=Eleginops maclovinus TaxID=56733 RepID=A0AAN7WS12_ELEMC|nr:hypothetical protein PBY51_016797 [Eleginops maclovinus]